MFCHICLQATTTKISSYLVCQSYLLRMWYMHDGAPAHFLSNTCHDRWTGRGGPTAWLPRSPDLNPLNFYPWEYLNVHVYAVPVDNEEALHHRIVDACRTILKYPGIFERMRRGVHQISRRKFWLIYVNINVNVRLFNILNLRKFFTDCFEILTQRCIRIRTCFYVPILYRCHTCDR
jgi:hypothetical protein